MKKPRAIDVLYCLFIANYVFSETQLVEYSAINTFFVITRYEIAGLLLILLAGKIPLKAKRKNAFILVVLLLSVVINMLLYDGGAGLVLMLIVVGAIHYYGVDVEQLIKSILGTIWVCSVFTIALCFVGVLEDRSGARFIGSTFFRFYDGSSLRHSYGFLVSNLVPLLLFVTYIYMIVIKRDKMKLYEHLIVLAANFLFLFLFGSRNSFLIVLLTMFAYFIARKVSDTRKKKNKQGHAVLWLVYPLCSAVSIVAAIRFDASVETWRVINNILMNRIIMSQTAIKTFGISLFGSGDRAIENLVVEGINSSTLDNGYINLLMRRGIIIAFIIILAWSWLTYRAEKEKNFYLVFCLVALAGSNLIDGHLTSYKMIPFFVLMLDKYNHVLTMKMSHLSKYIANRGHVRI